MQLDNREWLRELFARIGNTDLYVDPNASRKQLNMRFKQLFHESLVEVLERRLNIHMDNKKWFWYMLTDEENICREICA